MQGCIGFIESLQRIYYCKIQVKLDIGNHPQHFGPYFDLAAFRDRSDYREQCLFPFFISNVWLFKEATHPILEILVELFSFSKITLKSCIFVLLLPSWASSVGVKQCKSQAVCVCVCVCGGGGEAGVGIVFYMYKHQL